MVTKAETRALAQIKEILIEVSSNHSNHDFDKTAMGIYSLCRPGTNICGACGTNLEVEREMYCPES